MATKTKKRKFYCEQNRQAFNRWRDHAMKQMTAAIKIRSESDGSAWGWGPTRITKEAYGC